MSNTRAAFIYSEAFEKYHYPPECPFKLERAVKTRKLLASMGSLAGSDRKEIAPDPAKRSSIELIHSPEYLDIMLRSEHGDWNLQALEMGIGGPDTPVFKGMYDYGALSCGATLKGADLLVAGEADYVLNTSGGFHHAMSEQASGFCYINDVAIACKHLSLNNKKVLYLDIDAHHGDGVQNAFYDDNNVMTISLHENGKTLFPGTGFEEEIGRGKGKGYAVNLPLPADTYNDAYIYCFEEAVVPLIQSFNADLFVLELGADALAGDPLAHLKLTNKVYIQVLKYLMDLHKPLLVVGGGGYHVENTVRAWALAWSVLTGDHQDIADMNLGMGGVMLESTDWMGGLKDREIPVTDEQKASVEPAIESTIQKIRDLVFPIHGL